MWAHRKQLAVFFGAARRQRQRHLSTRGGHTVEIQAMLHTIYSNVIGNIATSSYVKWSETYRLIISHFYCIIWGFLCLHVDCYHSKSKTGRESLSFFHCMAKLWLSVYQLNAMQPHVCVGWSIAPGCWYHEGAVLTFGICSKLNSNICTVLQGYEGKKYTPITS